MHGLFGVYVYLVFVFAVLFAVVTALLVPGANRRAKLATASCKAIFELSGSAPTVTGLENIPDGHCVVVANHASYVDGFLLKGYLPWRFSFVIKGEVRSIPVVHFMFRRAGARFVERTSTSGSTRDARTLVKAARDGESLAFFAEGTFVAEPGLARFRPGAFVAAIRGSMPVVPVAISGTRAMLPANGILPKPVPIRIDVLPPIQPADAEYENSRMLAEAVRQRILAVIDDPDLAKPDRETN